MNVGVAAHITAASKGGPRYDPTLTRAQRRSADNGIWCCQTCGTLVDADDSKYTVEELREWKARAERRRELELLGRGDEQENRRRYQNRFSIVRCEVGGSVFRLAWKGPFDDLETIEPPQVVTSEELRAIHCALCKYESFPLAPMWEFIHDSKAEDVWAVNEELTKKWRLKSPHLHGARHFLRVRERHDPCCFCPRCGRTHGGIYCPTCMSEVREEVLLVGCP